MSHTVLLVDDEPNVLEGLTRVLLKEPYEILTANAAVHDDVAAAVAANQTK